MKLSHINEENLPSMVDVGEKKSTSRKALAQCSVILPQNLSGLLVEGKELSTKKGPVFNTAIIAGVMAAKQTANLIPFCHPLQLEDIRINIKVIPPEEIQIACEVSVFGKTGVEMEALTGASVAALTIYDMCKALSHEIEITSVKLVEKTGGKRSIKEGMQCD